MIDATKIQSFLEKVDNDFFSPLSSVTNLSDLATKYARYATLCHEEENGEITALVAGYTKNTPENKGYISLVAAIETRRHLGICTRLVSDFLEIAKAQGLSAVHVYTHYSNQAAVAMYKKNGFVETADTDTVSDTAHMICYLL